MILGGGCWVQTVSFLNMGTTLAVVQRVGIVACYTEAWKNSVNVGVSSSASVLSSLVGMWSSPVALCSLSMHSSLCTPFGAMCGISGCGLMQAESVETQHLATITSSLHRRTSCNMLMWQDIIPSSMSI